MEVVINERSKLIINSLITKNVLTLKELRYICNVSERTISKDLDSLEDLVSVYNLTLKRKPKIGIWLEGKQADKEKLYVAANVNKTKVPNTPKERQDYILLRLILNKNYITIQELCDEIYVSKGTLENDLDAIEDVLKKNELRLGKTTNKGIKLIGEEKKIRVLIADFFSKIIYVMPVDELIRYISLLEKDKLEVYSFEKELFNLFTDINLKVLENTIRELEKRLGYEFTDIAVTSLLIDMAIVINRIRTNNEVSFSEEVLANLETTKEFETVNTVVKEIEDIFNIKIPKSEYVYITVHIMGAKIQYNFMDNNEEALNKGELHGGVEDICRKMIERASQLLGVNFNNDVILLNGLSIHVRAAINRFMHDIQVKNPLLNSIKNSYISSFEAAVISSEVIKEKYKVEIDENEIAYIAIHFEAAIERMKNTSIIKKKVFVVCSTGIGTSHLVASKLKRVFDNIEVVGVVSSANINKKQLREIDFLITTIPLNINSLPVIRVNPLLLEEDLENIKRFLLESNSIIENKKDNLEKIFDLVDKDLILIKEKLSSKEEAIGKMCKLLASKGYINEMYYQSVLEREKVASTSSGRIALPHGDMDNVYKSGIAICTLDKKVVWGDSRVDFILLLAIKKNDVARMQNIFDGLYDIISDVKFISLLVGCSSKEEMLDMV